MSLNKTLCLALLAAAALLPRALAAERPDKPDHTKTVAAAVRLLEVLDPNARPGPQVWTAAAKLKALGREALPVLRKAAAGARSHLSRLALGWALLSLQDFGPGVKALSSVASQRVSAEARIAAARALGGLGADAAEVELTRLLDAVKADAVRVALARSLGVAATSEKALAKATTMLVRLARAGEGEVRDAAALALAELDDFRDPVPAVLKELSARPSPAGRLATKLLELHRLSKAMNREKEYSGSLGNPLLQEIKQKIMQFHIEPPPKEEALIDAAAHGMTQALHKTDPFSDYMSPTNWNDFRQRISGTYGGIGAHVMFLKDPRTGEEVFTAVKPIYTGPAYKAGLRSYDQFIEIDGRSIRGKTALELRDMLRGLPDSVVACKIRRRGLKKDRELLLKIVRSRITVPSVYHELLPGGIGYLRLDGFGDTSSREVEAALRAMEKIGLRALVFDLRGNPGGLLLAARDIADKFLKDNKLIVYSEGRNKKIAPRKELRTTEKATHPDIPMVVLVNGRSASASEIVAGALQDHKRAALLGTRTYGKGSVQQLMRLEARGRRAILKLTIAKYFLPSGRSIHRSEKHRGGIEPDINLAFEPGWTAEQFEKLRAAGDFCRYSLVQWPKHKKPLMELAAFDHRNPARYPGFDAWYKGLNVKTDRDSARRLLRQWLRRLTADERGRDWAGDLQEDNQCQRAVYEAARKLPGFDPASVPRFKWFVAEIEQRRRAKTTK